MKILLVEDDKLGLMVLKIMFDQLTHEAVFCSTGEDAIASFDNTFDLVITDCFMPNLSGLDVARTINSMTGKKVPIVLMSSMPDKLLQASAEESGAVGFLSKPITMLTLESKIKEFELS